MSDFWQPALPKAQLWRTIVGFVILILLFFAATTGLFWGAALLLDTSPRQLQSLDSPVSAALLFMTFLGFHLGLLIVLPLLHKRGYTSLFGVTRRLNLKHFLFGALVTVAIAGVQFGWMFVERLYLPEGATPVINQLRPVSEWVVWLLPALVLIFGQTFAEEAIFRGYLLQQLRARFRSPLIWGVLPSLIFGAMHYSPDTFGVFGGVAYIVNTTVTGVILCFVTLRTGNLGAAAGLHFANNAALVFFGTEGYIDGFTLFGVGMELQSDYAAWSILFQAGFNLVIFLVWWFWMNRRDKIANAAHAA